MTEHDWDDTTRMFRWRRCKRCGMSEASDRVKLGCGATPLTDTAAERRAFADAFLRGTLPNIGTPTPEPPAPEWPGFRTLPSMAMRCEDAAPGMHIMSPVDDFCQLCRVSAIKLRERGAGPCVANPPAKAPSKAAQHVEGIGRAMEQVRRPVTLCGALLRYRGRE